MQSPNYVYLGSIRIQGNCFYRSPLVQNFCRKLYKHSFTKRFQMTGDLFLEDPPPYSQVAEVLGWQIPWKFHAYAAPATYPFLSCAPAQIHHLLNEHDSSSIAPLIRERQLILNPLTYISVSVLFNYTCLKIFLNLFYWWPCRKWNSSQFPLPYPPENLMNSARH